MVERPVLVWFRHDLRVADNPALGAAAASGAPVLPVYVLDDAAGGRWRMGGASRWWLHGSLTALNEALRELGSSLTLRRGPAVEALCQIVRETGASAIFFNGHGEPHWREAERRLDQEMVALGLTTRRFAGLTLFEPGRIVTRQGQPFRVFTPFWRACRAASPPPRPQPPPTRLRPPVPIPAGDDLVAWGLLPTRPDWAGGLRDSWTPGEAAAIDRLGRFLDAGLAGYAAHRGRPEPAATSRLSAHLHFGEISTRQVWHATLARTASEPALGADVEAFLRQIGWREFYADILLENPDAADEPLQAQFATFPWSIDEAATTAWQRGRTGYPIVDAGMRQLWQTGWMHNRVRMVVASFLVKQLLQPWQAGEAWFWDTLVDADMANNAGGWQWVAGCGTDAAPYVRVFNPVIQGERFDPDGAYVRRWLPELERVPCKWVQRPWEAPPLELAVAGVRLGTDYPNRIVEHSVARARALAAFERLKTVS
jgi:Deoxyribodipyrimidine photolyase